MPTVKEKYDPLVLDLLKHAGKYINHCDKKKFVEAFEYAKEAHGDQKRQSNVPYIEHPVETAKILTDLHADEITLIAALLHDVPEDTPKTIEDIEKQFGSEVGFLVEGITKLSKVYYRHDMKVRQVESLKKLLLHSAKDPRVVLIKLADRLHNMRTLEFLREDKQKRIARETLEIHVPIANLLGIQGIKSELEDLCFKYLYPEEYKALKKKIEASQKKQKKVLEKMMRVTKREIKKEDIDAEISGRQKNLYSIYKKIVAQGKSIDDVDDRIAMRIIVNSRDECYIVLGIIHDFFKPKPARFKDYIAVPKNNGYRSIHTTVFGTDGVVTEFQIRTREMHLEAEYGIAAHYFYKGEKSGTEGHMLWAQRILEMQKYHGPNDPQFIENLKIDVFQDRIFVFTPKGDVIDLPRGATGIDFAYAIHSDVGNRAIRIEINGENFPITTTIPNNATVQVVTSNKSKGPEQKWMDFAKTQQARQSIREFLKKEDRHNKVKNGYELLSKELARVSLERIEDLNFKRLNAALQKNVKKTYIDLDSLLAEIGEGKISTLQVMQSLYPNYDLKNLDEGWDWSFKSPFKKKRKEPAKIWLKISSIEKMGQARKILAVIAENNVNVVQTIGKISGFHERFIMRILLEINSLRELSNVCDAVEQIDGVFRVERIPYKNQIIFWTASIFTALVWLVHPFLMRFILRQPFGNFWLRQLVTYAGLFLLIGLIYKLKQFSKKSFPGLKYVKKLWIVGFGIMSLAFLTIMAEIYFFRFELNWIVLFGIMTFLYAVFTAEYLRYINKHENS